MNENSVAGKNNPAHATINTRTHDTTCSVDARVSTEFFFVPDAFVVNKIEGVPDRRRLTYPLAAHAPLSPQTDPLKQQGGCIRVGDENGMFFFETSTDDDIPPMVWFCVTTRRRVAFCYKQQQDREKCCDAVWRLSFIKEPQRPHATNRAAICLLLERGCSRYSDQKCPSKNRPKQMTLQEREMPKVFSCYRLPSRVRSRLIVLPRSCFMKRERRHVGVVNDAGPLHSVLPRPEEEKKTTFYYFLAVQRTFMPL